VGELNIADQDYAIGRGLAAVRFFGVAPRLGWYLLQRSRYELLERAQGTTFEAVGRADLENIYLYVPENETEQRRIAEIVDTVDREVEGSHRAIAKLRIILDGLMHDVLVRPAEMALRRDGTSGWRVRSLGEVASVAAGVTLGSEPQGASSIELPYLRVANVQNGVIDTSELKTVRVPRTRVDRYLLRTGDVLLTEGGDFDKLGRGAVWDGRIPCCLHQNHIFRVRCDGAQVNPKFLSAYLGSPIGRRKFLLLAKQTTNLASINSTQLKSVLVPLPLSEEQERIVGVVASVEGQIEKMTAKARKLEQIRQGMVDDLLSGKVRVKLAGNAGM
jgi:type I restriction enzyme S subunit